MRKAMKTFASHRIIFASVLALTIFGAVYGFAATLNVSTNTLSAGNQSVASCQSTAVTGTYTTAYDSTVAAPSYKVSGVTVTGLSAACGSKSVSATLTDSAGLPVGGTWTGTSAAAGGSLVLTAPASPVPAATVTGVSVAING